jgi:hypothetical protein
MQALWLRIKPTAGDTHEDATERWKCEHQCLPNFAVASCDAAAMLDPVEGSLDAEASTIDVSLKADRLSAVAFRQNVSPDALGAAP